MDPTSKSWGFIEQGQHSGMHSILSTVKYLLFFEFSESLDHRSMNLVARTCKNKQCMGSGVPAANESKTHLFFIYFSGMFLIV